MSNQLLTKQNQRIKSKNWRNKFHIELTIKYEFREPKFSTIVKIFHELGYELEIA